MIETKSWQPTPFPVEVHADRIERVRSRMEAEGLDGMLLFGQETLFYLFGYDQIGYWVFQAVYLPLEGEAFAICRGPDAFMIEQSPFIDDVIVWSDDDPVDPSVRLVDRMTAANAGRTGVELGSHALLAGRWSALKSATEGRVDLVDASALVADLRAIKDHGEIEQFRQAARHLDRSYRALESELRIGNTELDLLAASLDGMYRDGASPTAIHPPIASGPRTLSQTHGSATNRKIGPGEPVTTEIGAASQRYHAVGARTYVLGEAPPVLVAMHDAASAALEAGFAGFSVGEPLSDVAVAAQAELLERGYTRAGRHFGYGTGIGFPPTWLEHLRIKVSDHRPAVPGMTFFYFVGLADPERQICVYVGEPVLVTENGAERLLPHDPSGWRR